MNYFKKYLKYKNKYLKYKNKYLRFQQNGGSRTNKSDLWQAFEELVKIEDKQKKSYKGLSKISIVNILKERNKKNISDIISIITKDPASARTEHDGGLPIHYAIGFSASLDVVKILIEKYPECIRMRNKWGYLPIHLAVMTNALDVVQLDVVQFILEKYPECIRMRNEWGYLPIHIAVMANALDVVQFILEKYPECIRIPDERKGYLPIHHAVLFDASNDVVKFILEKYPEGASVQDKDGKLPIHCIRANTTIEVVQFLLNADPTSAFVKDGLKHMLPMSIAIEKIASVDVVKLLIDANPGGVRETFGKSKELPIHYAIGYNNYFEVVDKLLEIFPESVNVPNSRNMLPFKFICEYNKFNLQIQSKYSLIQKNSVIIAVLLYLRHREPIVNSVTLSRKFQRIIEKVKEKVKENDNDPLFKQEKRIFLPSKRMPGEDGYIESVDGVVSAMSTPAPENLTNILMVEGELEEFGIALESSNFARQSLVQIISNSINEIEKE